MQDDLSDLDSLYKDARRAFIAQTKLKAAKKQEAAPPDRFRDPANWTRQRGIALIHAETQTLLGNFGEFIHKTEPGCRKLVREDAVMLVSATETVSGSWWLAADKRPEPRQVWHTQRPAVLHIHLDKLRLHSPGCAVIVHLSYGGIARVELERDTTFAQEDGKQAQLVFLSAGTNVLEEMSQDCKVTLRVQLELA